jgi:rhodanese-related sulfurtransferase
MVARFQEFTMRLLRSILLCVLALSAGLAMAQKLDPTKVPEEQRSKLGLYVLPKETPTFVKAQGGKVLFLDVRTRAEAQFMGMADGVDALVPYVEFQEFMTDWDDNRGFYKLEPFSDFAPEVERRLKAKGLTKNDTILLICRAGERSSRAADLLQSLGYTKVYTVLNGFEGELSAKGRRNVNGWKNDGLPWSYELDRKKMYFPR